MTAWKGRRWAPFFWHMEKKLDNGYGIVFDEQWFVRWQASLLWLLNSWLTGRWIRRKLGIPLPPSDKITQIGPNCFSHGDRLVDEPCLIHRKHFHGSDRVAFDRYHFQVSCKGSHRALQRTTSFRTSNDFALRLYEAFKPLWWSMHYWDSLVANRLIPAFDLGFSTLVVIPDPGSPGITSCAGDAGRGAGAETYPAIHNGAGTVFDQGSASAKVILNSNGTGYTSLYRVAHLYDTHSLTSSAVISSAVQSGFVNSRLVNPNLPLSVNLYGCIPASSIQLAASDYSNFGTVPYCDAPVLFSAMPSFGSQNFTVNATGIANISLTGITNFAYREATYDGPNIDPGITPSQNANIILRISSSSNNTFVLTVTYTQLTGSLGWDIPTETPRTNRVPIQPKDELLPAIMFPSPGIWGFEQSLPPLYQIPWARCEPVNSYPSVPPFPLSRVLVEESLSGLPFKISRPSAQYLDLLPRMTMGRGGHEAILPPAWKKPPSQPTFPDVTFKILGKWGWENLLPNPHLLPHSSPFHSDVMASPAGIRWGWENSVPYGSRTCLTRPLPVDGIPGLLGVAWGWEPSVPIPHMVLGEMTPLGDPLPVLQARIAGWETIGIFPAWQPGRAGQDITGIFPSIFKSLWGWEPALHFPGKISGRQPPPDGIFPSMMAGIAGWEMTATLLSRTPISRPSPDAILPSLLANVLGWEFIGTLPYHSPAIHQRLGDGFPLPLALNGSWGWEDDFLPAQKPFHAILAFDDWWPGIVVPNRVFPGGGYKPWYGWGYPEIYEDDDLRERLERQLFEIDEQLAALAAEEEEERRGARIIVPELLPPGWQDDGQGNWRDEVHGRRQAREEESRRQDPFRHVHYNFASDLDFGVRRRIIGILDRAEHRNVNIFGSEAFRTREDALVRGRFVGQGTNAWVLRLDGRARLELAREAIAEGFKLVSFDDTSLSFIHRQTFPWKPVLWGAAAGSTIMGAGIFTGWLIWGRKPGR